MPLSQEQIDRMDRVADQAGEELRRKLTNSSGPQAEILDWFLNEWITSNLGAGYKRLIKKARTTIAGI